MKLIKIGIPTTLVLIRTLLAGPPFQTDDPQPVEFHHWEVYFASQITHSADGVSGTAPEVEVNYGLLPNAQAHVIIPLNFNTPAGDSSTFGFGDIEFGLKYRFVNENGAVPQIGTFPHVEYPLGNKYSGLSAGHVQIFLPLWVQKSWGPWTSYGGGGYWIHVNHASSDSWFLGWEIQRDFSAVVTIGAELFMNTNRPIASGNETGFDVGSIINLSDLHHILFSIGRDITGTNNLVVYAAYQATFGGNQ